MRPRPGLQGWGVAVAFTVVLTAACSTPGSSNPTPTEARGDRSSTAVTGTITVAAASSLTEAFTAIAEQFEAVNPGVAVIFSFDSSGSLARQITETAPVDVFASADTASMDRVAAAGLVDTPTVFASNRLALVTTPGNPLGMGTLDDLNRARTVSLCATSAPCGALADRLLAERRIGLDESRVTRGQNVKATLTAVTEGDADAALVYATDARAAADRVAVVPIDDAANLTTTYPIALVAATRQRATATAFIGFVLGPAGGDALRDAGFIVG
jgi:molybdate transport system substrate-binding protein